MKVVAFNGSPRKNGNTNLLLQTVLGELEKNNVETKLIQLGNKPAQGCIACNGCFKNGDQKCVIKNDAMNDHIAEMIAADGIILGSPVYCANMSTNLKALIERASYVAKANNDLFKGKVGASAVAVRRAGASHVFSSINYFFLIAQMIVPASSYWNLGVGREPGEVSGDKEGMQTMVNLGKNMAELLKKLNK